MESFVMFCFSLSLHAILLFFFLLHSVVKILRLA